MYAPRGTNERVKRAAKRGVRKVGRERNKNGDNNSMKAKDYITRIPGAVRKKPRRSDEHDEQCAVFKWVRLRANTDERFKMIYAVPNGGARFKAEANRLKAAGVKAGVADIAVDVPAGGYHGLKIEMKIHGNKVTPKQEEYLNLAAKLGYKTAVCWNSGEAIDTIENYMRLS